MTHNYSADSGPLNQRRVRPTTAVKKTISVSSCRDGVASNMSNVKADGRAQASKYKQPAMKSNSARITGNYMPKQGI